MLQTWFKSFLKAVVFHAPLGFIVVGFLIVVAAALTLFTSSAGFRHFSQGAITPAAWSTKSQDTAQQLTVEFVTPGQQSPTPVAFQQAEISPPSQGRSEVTSVIVEPGQSWWSLAQTHLGDGIKYQQLADFNKKNTQDLLLVGQVVQIPSVISQARLESDSITESALLQQQSLRTHIDTTVYTVQPGDTLWSIANTELSDPYLWIQLYQLNSDSIADPDLLYPGMLLLVLSSGGG